MNRIRKRDLIKVLFRSFYIQGAWNYERMLGLGLCFCLIPVARRICRSEQEIQSFLHRHLDFFNAQPYMSSFALGALAKLEEQAIQQKWKDRQPITIFKERISGPLGALGDALFWKFLKPLTASIGVILSLLFGVAGIFTFLVLYNIPHLYIRTIGIFKGYEKGFDIISDLSIGGTRKYFGYLSIAANIIIGILTITSLYWVKAKNFGISGIIIFIILTLISISLTLRKKLSTEMIFVIILSISIIFGLMVQ